MQFMASVLEPSIDKTELRDRKTYRELKETRRKKTLAGAEESRGNLSASRERRRVQCWSRGRKERRLVRSSTANSDQIPTGVHTNRRSEDEAVIPPDCDSKKESRRTVSNREKERQGITSDPVITDLNAGNHSK